MDPVGLLSASRIDLTRKRIFLHEYKETHTPKECKGFGKLIEFQLSISRILQYLYFCNVAWCFSDDRFGSCFPYLTYTCTPTQPT